MASQSLNQRLAAGVAAARRSTNFCVSGCLANLSPGIEVAGVGPIKLPLRPATAKRLMAACEQAPYGKGTRTLVNTKVRDTLELAPAKFTLTNPQWSETILATVQAAAEKLGLPADRLEPQLYKLLFYKSGGFFLSHRDSEKTDRMVGSLIVALPTPFDGGRLTVRHQAAAQEVDFKAAAAGNSPCFAAFYADCEHEVSRVTQGFRLCLAYNLVLRAAPRAKKSPAAKVAETAQVSELEQSIAGWVAASPSEPLVFALDHHYTERGLALDLLKGHDRESAELILAAAEKAGCRASFCQVTRHTHQEANDGTWDRRWRSSTAMPKNIELGEIYEDELHGEGWVDADGKSQPYPAIPFDVASIVASTPLNQWTPTREDYEGYTGNAGNTLDRWYHRSAIGVWHRDHHFEVLAAAGVGFAIEMLQKMVGKLKKTAQKRLVDARTECLQLARAIVARWPKSHPHYYESRFESDGPRSEFPALLMEIDDPDTTRLFLQCAAERDPNSELDKLIADACKRHGCQPFAGELIALFETPGGSVYVRNFAWLDRLARAQDEDPDKAALVQKLVRLAAGQFCRPLDAKHYYRGDPAQAEKTLPKLLRTLLIAGDGPTLEQVIRHVRSQPERFSVSEAQTPALAFVVGWCRKTQTPVQPLIVAWLRALQQELSAATATEPQPPSDAARPAEISCTCKFCKLLNEFLADSASAEARIQGNEQDRMHMTDRVQRHKCDLTHTLDRSRRPFALLFTKSQRSFEQSQQRYLADCELLETVNELLLAGGSATR